MMWWWLGAAAVAQSSPEFSMALDSLMDEGARFLAEEAPAAEALLGRCAVQGCSRDEAAQAVWILAMDAYAGAGVAEGELAATLQVLDPDLFETLPDVVMSAATQPMGWALQVGGTTPPAQAPPPPVRSTTAAPEPPRAPVYLTVAVVDEAGVPVPAASVRFPIEGDTHRAHSQTGRWTASLLYLPDGTEYPFVKRGALQFDVWAPGYRYQQVSYVLSGRRKNMVTVQLKAGSPELPAEPHPVAERAIEAHETWQQAELAFVRGPDDAAREVLDGARRDLADAARDWLDAGGGAPARELCLMAGSLALCGAPR